jgi:two-component system, OmpR family, phosphate regulon response regulator PhoB
MDMGIKKILIADDDKPILSYMQRKFTKLGYDVYVAENGDEALQQVFSSLPDVVLLDVKMPGLSGIEVCKRLKMDDRTKGIPVLLLSARAQSTEVNEGLTAGADKYLCKPMSFPDILKEIRAFD